MLHIIQILTEAEQEACRVVEGMFEIFHEKFKPQKDETILYLQYCKLSRISDNTAMNR